MKVYISVDLEGVAAIATMDQIIRGGSGYGRAQELMTAETNAAVAGAFDAGATEVVVNDSHGPMDNLLPRELDPRVRLVVGRPKACGMVAGLTADCAAALFVGYHGAAGTNGVLAHTFSGHFHRVRLDGREVSEAEVNALYAGGLGVPVTFLSGDDVVCATTSRLLPDSHLLAVKSAAGWSAADSLHPAESCRSIRAGVAASLPGREGIARPKPRPGTVLEVEFTHPAAAELAGMVPGVTRVGATTVRRELTDAAELVSLPTVLSALGAAAAAGRGQG